MTMVEDVFNAAMAIMDELNDSGEAQTTDTQEYKNRTLPIMNVLISECYPYSDSKDTTKPDSAWRAVTEFDDSLYKIDDTIALGIMPYGLAANLLVDENPSAASFYQARYEERLREKARRVRASVEDIEDIYGGIGHGWFSSWG